MGRRRRQLRPEEKADSKRKRPLEKTQELLQNACLFHHSQQTLLPGDRLSIRQTALKFEVSYFTLRNRIKGLHQNARKAHEYQQSLSIVQERVVVEWLNELSNQSVPLSKRTLRKKVQDITGGRIKPGKQWITRFLARHPSIKLGKPSGLDPKRAQCFNRTTVTNHFELLEKVFRDLDIPWENVWNMDEKGCQRGGGRKTSAEKYFVPRNKRPCYRQRSGNLELVTIIECVNASGDSIKPGFVFPGKQFHRGWLEVDPEINVSVSPNGWTDEFLCTEWFKKCFIPQATAKNTSGKPILLIFDGHGSHLTEEIHQLALSHNIHLFCLPAHTTHRLQPLDVGVFGPLATAMARRCDQVLQDTGAEIPVQDFVKEYMLARDEAFKAETIEKAFKNSGIRPLNPNIFTEADYAPSRVSSTQAHTPSTYPPAVFGYQPYAPLPRDENDLSDEEPCDMDISDGEDGGDGDGPDGDGDGNYGDINVDGNGNLNASGEGYDGEDTNSMDENNIDEEEDQIINQLIDEPSHAGSSNHHQMPQSPSPYPPAPVELPDIAVEDLHRRRNPEPFELDPELTQPLQLSQALAEIQRLAERVRQVENKLDETTTHCAMAVGEIANLKGIINAKNQRKTRSTTAALNSRWITSGDGLVEFNQQIAAQKNKKEKLAEAKRRREVLVATKRAERDARGPTLAFRGSLTPKTKDDLLEIITALVIPMEAGKKFKKEELIDIIQTHLNTHPMLKDNPRFAGLFGGRRQGLGSADKENPPRPVANTSVPSAESQSASGSSALSMATSQPFIPSSHLNTIPHVPHGTYYSYRDHNYVHSYNPPQYPTFNNAYPF